MSDRRSVRARLMYLHDNILRSHRGDHFSEGHRSRSAVFFRRRSRSADVESDGAGNQDTDILTAAVVASDGAANQDTDTLTADHILKTKSWPAKQEHLAHQNKDADITGPGKPAHTFWMALPQSSNPPVVWTALVGSCHPARFSCTAVISFSQMSTSDVLTRKILSASKMIWSPLLVGVPSSKRGSPSDMSNCTTFDIGVTPSTAKGVWEPKMGVTRAYLIHAAPCVWEFFTSASSVVLARMVTYSHTRSAFVKTTPSAVYSRPTSKSKSDTGTMLPPERWLCQQVTRRTKRLAFACKHVNGILVIRDGWVWNM